MSEINLPLIPVENCPELLKMLKDTYKAEKTETHYVVQRNDLDRLKNARGETLLFIAVKTVNVVILKLLIEAGADVNSQDESGQTPILQALKNIDNYRLLDFKQMITILYEANANFCTADKRGKSPAQIIAFDLMSNYNGSFVHDYFLEFVRRECGNDSESIAKKLINLKYPLWEAVRLRNAQVIEHMIIRGWPVDRCRPVMAFTALHQAVELGDLEIVEVLIKRGANPDITDWEMRLPIDHLNDSCDNVSKLKIIEILLAKTSIQPGHLSAYQYVRKVFEYGTRNMVRAMLERVEVENRLAYDEYGMFPLHYLVKNRHSDIIEELRGRQINVDVRNNAGRTPLHLAVKLSYIHANTIRFLLENGADPTDGDYFCNKTPLMYLCMNDSETKYREIAEILLLHGLDSHFVEKNPKTILEAIGNLAFYKAEPVLKHFAMLDEMKRPISEVIRDKVNASEKCKSYVDVCKAELAEMKNRVIHKKLTLHTIITDQMDVEKILRSCTFNSCLLPKFKELKEELQPNNYYHTVIQKRISIIISKIEVMQKAWSVMCKLLKMGNNPYHMIVTKIMSYLNTGDHQTLVELDN